MFFLFPYFEFQSNDNSFLYLSLKGQKSYEDSAETQLWKRSHSYMHPVLNKFNVTHVMYLH